MRVARVIYGLGCLLIGLFEFSYGQMTEGQVIDSLKAEMQKVDSLHAKKIIHVKEVQSRKRALGQYSDHVSPWRTGSSFFDVLDRDYAHLSDRTGLFLYIPEYYRVKSRNGVEYIKVYLLNLTDSTVKIPCISGVFEDFTAEIFIDGKWQVFQKTYKNFCGNSYWTRKLNNDYVDQIQVSCYGLMEGSEGIPIRYVLALEGGERIYSNQALIFPNSVQIRMLRWDLTNK